MRHLRLTPTEQKTVNRRHNLVIIGYTTLILAGVASMAVKAPVLEASRQARTAAAVSTVTCSSTPGASSAHRSC